MDDNNEESEFCKQTAASVATSEISSADFFSNFQSHTALVEEYIDEVSDKVVVEDSNLIKLEQDEKDELGPIVDTPFRVRCYTWPRHHQCMQGHFKVNFIFGEDF